MVCTLYIHYTYPLLAVVLLEMKVQFTEISLPFLPLTHPVKQYRPLYRIQDSAEDTGVD
jgi:hypothetical protein